MAMFGTLKKPANPFAIEDEAGRPIVAGDSPPMDMGDFTPSPRPETGFNRQGGMADKLGQLGAFLLSNTENPNMAPMQQMMHRQDRENALADWRAKFEFQQANKAPPAPYRFQDNQGNLIEIGPDGAPRQTFTDPNPKPVLNWLQVKDPATGTVSLVPVGPNGPIMGGGDPTSGSSGGGMPPTSPGGMPDWWSTFTPEERAVIMTQGRSRLGSHVPSGNPASTPKTLPPDFDFGDGR